MKQNRRGICWKRRYLMETSRKPLTGEEWVRNLKPGLSPPEHIDLGSAPWQGREKKGMGAGSPVPDSDMHVKVMGGD